MTYHIKARDECAGSDSPSSRALLPLCRLTTAYPKVAMVSSFLRRSIVAFACLSSGLAASIQDPDLALPSDAATHRQNVKNIFLTSWDAYMPVDFALDASF